MDSPVVNVHVATPGLDEALPKLERAAVLMGAVGPSPGIRTSEGIASLMGAAGALLTLLLKSTLDWQHVAAMGLVAAILIAYGVCRTVLKARGLALLLVLLLAAPARADEPPALAPIRAPVVVPVVPPEAITPQCPPPAQPVKPAPAWASYLGWGLAAATEILTLSVTLYQRAP